MKMKSLTALICLCSLFMSMTSCGPAPLSDEEFIEAAKPICQVLESEIDELVEADFAGHAVAYKQAVEALSALNINEQSAPQGTLLRGSLTEMSETIGLFAAAVTDGLAGAGIEEPTTIMITEDGNVFASTGSGSIFNQLEGLLELDIDPALTLELTAKQAALKEAATAAGLEQCAP